jgi:WS/DGAT/MGAT family acyltransferase
VENYRGGSALIGRFHHCMGDGIGLMMVLLAMSDFESGTAAGAADLASRNPFLNLVRGDDVDIAAVRRKLERLMPEGMRLLLKPLEAFRALGVWRRGAACTAALVRLTFRSSDSKTLLNARLGVPKRAAWSDATPIEEIQRIREGLGGTVNDLLLTALAGGVRRYLLERDGEAGCKDFRATIPVNLRPLEKLATLGNEFGLVYLSLPVRIADPVARLAELRRRMEKLKRSAESLVSLRVLSLMGRLPAAAQRGLVRMFASKATAVMTNVPGPAQTLYIAGNPIREMLFWVPRSARLSLGVSILTYAGKVCLGIATDAGLVPDPERIVEGYQRELAAMRELALANRSATGAGVSRARG